MAKLHLLTDVKYQSSQNYLHFIYLNLWAKTFNFSYIIRALKREKVLFQICCIVFIYSFTAAGCPTDFGCDRNEGCRSVSRVS